MTKQHDNKHTALSTELYSMISDDILLVYWMLQKHGQYTSLHKYLQKTNWHSAHK